MARLAKYESRPARRANIAAWLMGVTLLTIAVWIAFDLVPPRGWREDQAVEANLDWICANWQDLYRSGLAQRIKVLIGLREVSSAIDATVQLVLSHGLFVPFAVHSIAAGFAAFIASMVTHSVVLRATPVVDMREHVEGLKLLRGREALDSATAQSSREAGRYGLGMQLAPGVAMSKLRELRGILLLGAPGSGKTRIILYLIEAILAMMRVAPHRRVRLLIHDTTGEMATTLPLRASRFALLHGHKPGGYAWAMGRDVRTTEDAEATAAVFAPESEAGIWTEGSTTILAGCLVLCQARSGTDWGADEFYGALLTDSVALRAELEALYPPAAELIVIDPDTGGLSKTTVSFFLSFRAAVLRQMRPLAVNWKGQPPSRRFSFIDWLEMRPGTPDVVVVQRSGKYPELSAAWIGAVIDTISAHASDESFANSQARRVFLCLDELAALKRLRRLPDLLDVGRNKGIGVIAALQELEQLTEHYGPNLSVSLLKRFRTKIICQQNQDEATDKLSAALIGKRTVNVEQVSQTKTVGKDGTTHSTSTTKQPTEVPIVRGERLAYDLGVIGNSVKALVVGLGDTLELNWPVTVWPKRRDG